jgi:type IV secretion system protein VirB5
MKTRHIVIASMVSIAIIAPVHAAFPVIDIANLAQAINQIAAWKQQFEQMSAQYKQLERQYAAVTGSRNLGQIVNNPALRDIVPQNVGNFYFNIHQRGSAGLSPHGQAIRQQTRIYDCENRRGQDQITCQAALNNNAQLQAMGENAMTIVNQRVTQIQSLQNQINSTQDAKAIAELQARLQVETTQVNNDANRLTVMKLLSETSAHTAQQALRERQLKNLALNTDGSENFVYKPFSRNR